MIRHSLHDRMFKLKSYWCINRAYQSHKVSYIIFKRNKKLWVEIQINYEHSYQLEHQICV